MGGECSAPKDLSSWVEGGELERVSVSAAEPDLVLIQCSIYLESLGQKYTLCEMCSPAGKKVYSREGRLILFLNGVL
jgi:hypothetical protein